MSTNIARSMRVRIAKDVIRQLRGGRIVTNTEVYIACHDRLADEIADQVYADRTAIVSRKHVNRLRKCGVCAIAAMFLSKVAICKDTEYAVFSEALCNYSTTIDHGLWMPGPVCRDELRSYFDMSQLTLIERCYEGSTRVGRCYARVADVAIMQWINELPDSTDRMLAIMQNIVDHNGTFVPEILTEVLGY